MVKVQCTSPHSNAAIYAIGDGHIFKGQARVDHLENAVVAATAQDNLAQRTAIYRQRATQNCQGRAANSDGAGTTGEGYNIEATNGVLQSGVGTTGGSTISHLCTGLLGGRLGGQGGGCCLLRGDGQGDGSWGEACEAKALYQQAQNHQTDNPQP